MTKRQCAKCKLEYPATLDYFYHRAGRKEGTLLGYCKGCYNEIQKQKHNELKQRLLNYKGRKCVVCGYDKYNGSLDFHHLDSSKKELKIGQTRRTFETLKKEIDKCVVVCRNCHGEIHGGLNSAYLVAP